MSEREIILPRYKCHKEVNALKIYSVEVNGDNGGAKLYFEDCKYEPLFVDQFYTAKHAPSSGGYYVVYDDGYTSFSPAKAFEEGYILIEEEA